MDKQLIARIIFPVGVIIILWLIADRFFGISASWKEKREEKERQLANEAEKGNEYAKVISEGGKLSMPKSKYRDLSDALYNAMAGVGTDENRVFQVISNLKNDLDFLELTAAFGVRDGENLTTWINGDLSSGKIAELNKYLRSKKIKYSF